MMPSHRSATAVASPNLALIKYWGNRDPELRLPSSGSISMTLGGLQTQTTVTFDPAHSKDEVILQGSPAPVEAAARVSRQLDEIRRRARLEEHARVESQSNFPAGTGIASSASAFAALTVAAAAAAGLQADAAELSRLARLGSGSACRSIYGGFAEWLAGDSHETSYAVPLADADHWPLVDIVAVVSQEAKPTGSTEGHRLASTSPLQSARVADAPRRLKACREAILHRDFEALAPVVEQDSMMMHAVMLTSSPPLLYWHPATLTVLQHVAKWRGRGLGVVASIDAGPNVHCVCSPGDERQVQEGLVQLSGVVEVLRCPLGSGARLLSHPPEAG